MLPLCREAPWRPTFAVNGSLSAGDFGGDGLIAFETPCGTMDAEVAPRGRKPWATF